MKTSLADRLYAIAYAAIYIAALAFMAWAMWHAFTA